MKFTLFDFASTGGVISMKDYMSTASYHIFCSTCLHKFILIPNVAESYTDSMEMQ